MDVETMDIMLFHRTRTCPFHVAPEQLHAAGDVEVTFVDPCVWLWYMCRTSLRFGRFMQQELRRIPCAQATPWQIALYSDEVSPGNQLKSDNRRSLSESPW